jgi:hypothetical protein
MTTDFNAHVRAKTSLSMNTNGLEVYHLPELIKFRIAIEPVV